MFDGHAFHSWSHILAGALLFAVLFGTAASMGEALFEGTFRLTRVVSGMALGAFVGYLGVALLIRREGDEV